MEFMRMIMCNEIKEGLSLSDIWGLFLFVSSAP
ncbi:Hypothetical protein BROD_0194 [Brucella sp. NF 2653]|nr:Hypothetical protein BIBO1_2450 [Brucella inopinata BO1]EFM63646.1 Hypothetical protein BROD_0194 [Brucella sp. NF 2653]